MTLVSEEKYYTEIGRLWDIPRREVSGEVIALLNDVRANIEGLDPLFKNSDLARVLEVVESGKYEVGGEVLTKIDLSSAKSIIDTYRKYSEGGCQSCKNLGRETIDAQDASSGWYCKNSDPDYDSDAIGRPKVRYSGFSPKVERHYKDPCNVWTPEFFPKLEELIKITDALSTNLSPTKPSTRRD